MHVPIDMRLNMTVLLYALFVSLPLAAAERPAPPPAPITISSEMLGDVPEGIVSRITLSYELPKNGDRGPAEITGSISVNGATLRTFRYQLLEQDASKYSFVQVVPPGQVEVEARIVVGETDPPFVAAKGTATFAAALTGKTFKADAGDAESIAAEGAQAAVGDAIHIRPPKRDVAPNLFIVDVDTKPPVKRVEFWIEDKKIFTKNAPPYHAELDLGATPRRVEVRVVGYDATGRYVDADAFVVNERSNPVEAKITRTVGADGVAHLKVSVQNHDNVAISNVVLMAGDRQLAKWERPPYALDVAAAQLGNAGFVRTSVFDAKGIEVASDLLFLDGTRFAEQLEVNMIELPVSVFDRSGAAVAGLTKENFRVLEQKKPQKIATFNFATDLPLSVGVLVDHSGSMKPRIDTARKAALEFFSDIVGPKDQAFFGGFSWQANHISPFSSDVGVLRGEVDEMPDAEGGTALYDAIVTALYKFRDVQGRKALVVVTDGEDTVSRLGYDQMLTYVRTARIPVYFIGIGMSTLGSSKIRSLASETGGVAYMIGNVDALKDTYAKLERELRSQYQIGYYTEADGKKAEPYRQVEVTVDKPDAIVRTIRGYIP